MKLFLLTEVSGRQKGTLAAGGRFWCLEQRDLATGVAPEFICISYTWGSGREPSPFQDQFFISDRTISVINSVAHFRPACQRIWVDALCVPLESPERESTLESTHEVIAVLSESVLPALRQMREHTTLTEASISLLEKDEWVTRAWTYQETVNARALFVTCDATDEVIINGQDLINYVGQALSKLTIPPLERRAKHPGLDALEDLVDYLTAGAGERSAMQVMAKMDRRRQERQDDHFYAMIGAISWKNPSATGSDDASEVFMQICETKGDFSFIFSAAPRDTCAGRRWRPVRGHIPAILPWDSWGPGESGEITTSGLRLGSVVKLGVGGLTPSPRAYIHAWLEDVTAGSLDSADDLKDQVSAIVAALKLMGFAGSGKCFTTPAGFFFPFEGVVAGELDFIVISCSLRWIFGSPGLLCYKVGTERLYTAGILVGCLDGFFGRAETLV